MLIFDYITWDLDPVIFRIGKLAPRYYGLLFAAAFYVGYLVFRKYFKMENIHEDWLDKLTVYTAVGTVIGARLGHCLFYEPEYYLSNPIEILKIWHGGLASHGAAIGILIALWYYAKKINKPYMWILDRIVIVVALAGFFIRMGNFTNSEIYGIQTSLPWGVIFERNFETVPKHPTQLYEAFSYLLIFFGLHRLYMVKESKVQPGLLFGVFLIVLFFTRFLIEFIKEDQVGFESGMALNMGQWLSLPFIAAGFVILYFSFNGKFKTTR